MYWLKSCVKVLHTERNIDEWSLSVKNIRSEMKGTHERKKCCEMFCTVSSATSTTKWNKFHYRDSSSPRGTFWDLMTDILFPVQIYFHEYKWKDFWNHTEVEIIVFNWSDDDFGAVRLFRLSLKASLYCVLRTQEIIVHLVLPVRNIRSSSWL